MPVKPSRKWISKTFKAIGTVLAVTIALLLFFCMTRTIPAVGRQAMQNADTFELLSLNPYRSEAGFHHHEIVGRMTIGDKAMQRRLIDALNSGVRWSCPLPAECFSPRHAIRVTHRGVITDLLICFECMQVEIWQGENRVAWCTMSDGPRELLNQLLTSASVQVIAGWSERPEPPVSPHE